MKFFSREGLEEKSETSIFWSVIGLWQHGVLIKVRYDGSALYQWIEISYLSHKLTADWIKAMNNVVVRITTMIIVLTWRGIVGHDDNVGLCRRVYFTTISLLDVEQYWTERRGSFDSPNRSPVADNVIIIFLPANTDKLLYRRGGRYILPITIVR